MQKKESPAKKKGTNCLCYKVFRQVLPKLCSFSLFSLHFFSPLITIFQLRSGRAIRNLFFLSAWSLSKRVGCRCRTSAARLSAASTWTTRASSTSSSPTTVNTEPCCWKSPRSTTWWVSFRLLAELPELHTQDPTAARHKADWRRKTELRSWRYNITMSLDNWMLSFFVSIQ